MNVATRNADWLRREHRIDALQRAIDKLDATYQKLFKEASEADADPSRPGSARYLWTRCDRIEWLLNRRLNERDDLIRERDNA